MRPKVLTYVTALCRRGLKCVSSSVSLRERAAHPDADLFNEETHDLLIAERRDFFKVEL
jgi:hypothetical protein